VLQHAAGIANHLAKLECDRLEMGINATAAFGGQGVQQLIAPEILIRLHFEYWRRELSILVGRHEQAIDNRQANVTLTLSL
jgi:hypothetical protein